LAVEAVLGEMRKVNMGIQYIKYTCSACGGTLSNNAIILAHLERRCIHCGSTILIDANKAIPNTLKSQLGFVTFVVSYLFLLWFVSVVAGINVEKFFMGLAGPFRLLFVVCVLLPGFLLAMKFEKYEKLQLEKELQDFQDRQ